MLMYGVNCFTEPLLNVTNFEYLSFLSECVQDLQYTVYVGYKTVPKAVPIF